MRAPRDWLVDPVYFAKGTRRWKAAATSSERALRHAAMWQEQVVRRLKGAISAAGRTQSDVAAAVHISKDAMSRIITGTSWIELRHIALFEDELNVDLIDGTRPDREPTGEAGPGDGPRRSVPLG